MHEEPASASPGAGTEAPPADVEHASERRIGAVESTAPRPDADEGVVGFLEPDDTQAPDEPLLQPGRGS